MQRRNKDSHPQRTSCSAEIGRGGCFWSGALDILFISFIYNYRIARWTRQLKVVKKTNLIWIYETIHCPVLVTWIHAAITAGSLLVRAKYPRSQCRGGRCFLQGGHP